MLISLNWLKEYVDIRVDVPTVAERLTLAGNEVGRIAQQEVDFDGVVVAQVNSLRPLPGSSKNQIAGVSTGGAVVEVVTGAWNIAVGDRVPYATPGSRLGERRIETKTFLRFPSAGMLCSAIELGLGDDATGIMILDPGATPGQDLHELYPRDTILELEIKSNRPDLLCHVGIAREVGAIFMLPVREPKIRKGRTSEAPDLVRIDAPDGCRRFVGRLITGVTVAPSPPWMQARLRAAGVRPISNIVDITNYVMLETGQPMHAFDYQRLNDGRIIVRRARDGEELACLDGKTRRLSSSDMVVADTERAQGLAGIIGGAESAVQQGTTEILLEAATWEPRAIRRTARMHGLRTEASSRFEKGLSPGLSLPAVEGAAALVGELAGGTATRSSDVYAEPLTPITIALDADRIERILGVRVEIPEAASILERLGFTVRRTDGSLQARPPEFRLDCSIPEDLVEEIGRIYGYDRVPSTLPGARVPVRDLYERRDADETAREVLAGRELDEAVTSSLVSLDGTLQIALPFAPPALAKIKNPMAENRDALRRSLLPGLLEALALNARQDQGGARLFELGSVFWRKTANAVDEPQVLALATHVQAGGADAAVAELRSLQATLATMRARFAMPSMDFKQAEFGGPDPGSFAGFHPGRTGEVLEEGEPIGIVGEVHPQLLAELGLTGRAVVAEVLFDRFSAGGRRTPQARPLPRFPGVRRDLTVVLRGKIAAADLLQVIRQQGGYTLREISMVSEYQGPQLEAGARSLSFRLHYQADDRTLTNEEVAAVQQRVIDGLRERFGAEVRS
ncbi:MAG: phenylalanine--tRNA ligase subunit beta [Candidatus Dormibacteraeota bacterium]|nr:phenylalanine--tRNA ligase subunit beta [Candidatus Dormibacteraeota bacterium]